MAGIMSYILLAGVAPILAALVPLIIFKNDVPARVSQIMLGISAGLLLSIATLDLIPEAAGIVLGDGADLDHFHERIRYCMAGMGAGYFCLLTIDTLSPHSHGPQGGHGHSHGHSHSHGHTHNHSHSHSHGPVQVKTDKKLDEEIVENIDLGDDEELNRTSSTIDTAPMNSFSYTAFIGLAIHSFIDGVIIAGAFNASSSTGEAVGFAIVLHKFPDGLVLSSLLLSGERKVDWSKFYYIVIVSFMSPLGAILGRSLLSDLSLTTLGFTLGFGAGSFLFISCTGIMSELMEDHDSHARMMSLISVIFGYGMFVVLGGGHSH